MSDELYQDALAEYGEVAQVDKTIEELSELTAELAKTQLGQSTDPRVVEELADVEIMCEQLRLIYDPDAIEEAKASKKDRLRERLND